MEGFLDIPYRLPFTKYYQDFDRGFYVDFPKQLELMGRWLLEYNCSTTLDIGAMTGGCIEYISRLGIRMDGVQFSEDVKRLAATRLRKAGIASTLFVSPVYAPLKVPARTSYDGIVSLGWFNLPFTKTQLRRDLRTIHRLLAPGGVFLFDFFSFKNLIVEPPEAVTLAKDLFYASRSERLGSTLRRHHVWLLKDKVLSEYSDLVNRSAAGARGLLKEAGFSVEKTRHLDFNYPREFWLARKAASVG